MIIYSKQYLQSLYSDLKLRSNKLLKRPLLAIVQVGSDSASNVYIRQKVLRAAEVGIETQIIQFSAHISGEILIDKINELNDNQNITAYIIQLPLPKHINVDYVVQAIDPRKDADGFHPYNYGLFAQNKGGISPCTPAGIIWFLDKLKVDLTGMNVTVLGRSNHVGKPTATFFEQRDATVTLCHSKTNNIKQHTLNADIIVVAIGKPNFIKNDMIKKGAIVIDVGIHRLDDGSLCGDVDFDSCKDKAHMITPVPGGVGPLTVAMLLQNVVIIGENNV